METFRLYAQARQKRLAELIEKVGSQAKVADRLDVSPSYISQLLTGHRIMGDQTAARIEQIFNLECGLMDRMPAEPGANDLPAVVFIPQVISQGGGERSAKFADVPFRRACLDAAGLDPSGLQCMYANSDEMADTIAAGDCILVQMQFGRLESGRIYLITWAGELRLRRVFSQPDSGLRLIADNPARARFPDEFVNLETIGFSLVGRVVWRGGFL